jgi:hypothetical protein
VTNFERYFIGFGTALGLMNGHFILAGVVVAIAIFLEVTPNRLPSDVENSGGDRG